jgi:hypothetical protein
MRFDLQAAEEDHSSVLPYTAYRRHRSALDGSAACTMRTAEP